MPGEKNMQTNTQVHKPTQKTAVHT